MPARTALAPPDTLELANALVGVPDVGDAAEWQGKLEPQMRQFEETMLAWAAEKVGATTNNQDMFMAKSNARAAAAMLSALGGRPSRQLII